MVKQLTDSEQEAMETAMNKLFRQFAINLTDTHGFEHGFIAGLSYNQAKLDSERQERIAHNKQVNDKLTKLVAYIKGTTTYGEIEEIINA